LILLQNVVSIEHRLVSRWNHDQVQYDVWIKHRDNHLKQVAVHLCRVMGQ